MPIDINDKSIKPFYRVCQKVLNARVPVDGIHRLELDPEEYAAVDREFLGTDDDVENIEPATVRKTT